MAKLLTSKVLHVLKSVVEIAVIAGAVSLLSLSSVTGVMFANCFGPLALGVSSWALFNARTALQKKILTGSFTQDVCPTGKVANIIILATTIATQIVAIAVAASIFPSLIEINGALAYTFVTIVAFVGAVLSNIPNKLLTILTERE